MAGKTIKGITVEIGGNTTKLSDALKKVNDKTISLQKELRGVNTLLKMNPSNVTLVTQKQELLKKAITETKEKLDILKEAEAQVQAQFEKSDITEEQYRDFQREIVATENKLSNLEKQQEEYNKSLKETAEEIKDTRNSFEKLTDEVEEQTEELASLKNEYKNVILEQGENSESAKKLREKINALNDDLEENRKKIKEIENASKSYSEKMVDLGDKVSAAGDKITNAGKKASKFSAVAGGALGLAGKTAIDFETAWTGVTKTVEGTDEQLATVRQGILDLAETTASSSEDIATVAEAAGQLGIQTDNIIDFTDAIVRLGDSTNLVGDEGAAQLAKFANIVGMSQDKFENLGSAIVDLGNNYATTEQDIVNMAMRLAGAGKQVGFSEGEILGLATALSSVGVEAEMGGSAISKAMVKMQSAVEMSVSKLPGILKESGMSLHDLQLMASNDSKGFKDLAQTLDMTSKELTNIVNAGVDLENFSAVSGMSAEQFKTAWKEDAAGALSSFIKGLGDAEDKGNSAITMLSEMGLTEVRLRDSLLRAANAGDLFNKAMDTGNKAYAENTALANESNKRYETTAAKLSQAKETLKNVAVSLGETLLPIISSVADGAKKLLNHFTNLSPVTQKIILVVTGIVVAIGPLLIIIGKFASAIGSIIKILPDVKAAISVVKGAMAALNTTMLANPIFLIIAAITALVAAFVILYNKCDWFREAVDKVWGKIKEGFQSVVEWVKSIPEKISVFFSSVINFFKDNWQGLILLIVNPFAGAFKLLYDNCEGFRETINNLVEKIKLFFTETIPAAIQTVIRWFSELPYKIGVAIGLMIGHIINFGKNVFDFFTVKLPEYITIAINWFKLLPKKIWNAIVSAITNMATWCSNMKTKAQIGITNLINSVINWFKSLPNKISSVISSGVTAISTWCSNMKTKAVSGVKNVANSVINGFKSLPNKMLNIGKNIVEGIWNGIKNAKNWIIGKVNDFAKGILDGMKSALGIHSPSRVFRDEIGKFISQGIGVGIIENQDAPIEALESVGNNMLDSAKNINGLTLNRQIENTFSGSVSTNGAVLGLLDEIISKLDRNTQIVLDSGKLVGETAPAYDGAFGSMRIQTGRGW